MPDLRLGDIWAEIHSEEAALEEARRRAEIAKIQKELDLYGFSKFNVQPTTQERLNEVNTGIV